MKLIDYEILSNRNRWFIFLLLALFSNNLTYRFNTCNELSLVTFLLLLFHDSIAVYIAFGALIFKNYLIHSLLLIIILLNWYIFDECIVTTFTNYMCRNNPNEKYINPFILIIDTSSQLIYVFMGLSIFYDVYNIFNN